MILIRWLSTKVIKVVLIICLNGLEYKTCNNCNGFAAIHINRLGSHSHCNKIRLNRIHVSHSHVSEIKNSEEREENWRKDTLGLAIPALIGMIADPFLSLVDTFFTGKLGTKALAALGPCTSIFHLFFNAFRATTFATTSLVANNLSEDEESSSAEMVICSSLQFSVLTGVCLTAILLQFSKPILSMMGVSGSRSCYPSHHLI